MTALWAVMLVVLFTHETHSLATRSDVRRDVVLCADNDALVRLYKNSLQTAYIYVQDEHGTLHNATEIAGQCLYDISETPNFLFFRVSYNGCHVRQLSGFHRLLVVVNEPFYGGSLHFSRSVPIICPVTQPPDTTDLLYSSKYCDQNGFNIVIFENATAPPVDVNSLRVEGNQSQICLPKRQSVHSVSFQFPFTSCGAQSQVHDGNITFWVKVVSEKRFSSNQGSVYKEAPFTLIVFCTYALTNTNIGMAIDLKAPPSLDAFLIKKEGAMRAEMRFATDSSFRSFYKIHGTPVMHVLGEPVYVEIFVHKLEDKELVLRLDDCWATTNPDLNDDHRWNLIQRGCPQKEAGYSVEMIEVQPGEEVKFPKLHKRLKIQMFSFVETEEIVDSVMRLREHLDFVYLHCDAEVCKGHACDWNCDRKRR